MTNRFLTNYIWLPQWEIEDAADALIVYFRKEFVLDEVPERLDIQIMANSRYKLYLNGVFVQEGPQKGTTERAYVDTAELACFVRKGENVAAVEVLRYPEAKEKRNDSLYHSAYPCLYVAGAEFLDGNTGWRCRKADSVTLKGEPFNPAPIHAVEEVVADSALRGWKNPGYDDSAWISAKPYTILETGKPVVPFITAPSTIPHQMHKDCCFDSVVCIRKNQTGDTYGFNNAVLESEWEKLLRGCGTVEIPAGSTQIVELDAGELECGYLTIALCGGKGAQVVLNPAESYVYPQPPRQTPRGPIPVAPKKGDRTDWQNGVLTGIRHSYQVAGYGDGVLPESYEPYWFMTFRYLRIEITTADEPLTIRDLGYRSTGYPLTVRTSVTASDKSFAAIWDICERTLRRCMHETYFDCPYYEQLQYCMDARSEILFTYQTAADDRLARQCMEALRNTQRADGMIQASAPATIPNIIPGFAIYYILMVHDHMMYFGDKMLVKHHMNCIDGILNFFDEHRMKNGMVESVGGVLYASPYWSFIDWSSHWSATAGVPSACRKGSHALTMESLLYLYGLQKAAELAEFLGRKEQAMEYRLRAKDLSTAILANCTGLRAGVRLIQDGPGVDDYSVHCQIFAILTGIVTPEEGRALLAAVYGKPEYPQASVAFSFYLFRALEMIGCYEQADRLWDLWRKMIKKHLTTTVENDTDERSDCHGWSACMLYELPAVYLGVRPAAPGYEKVAIRPQMGHLDSASGNVITPKGMIHVEWKRNAQGQCDVSYTLPEGIEDITNMRQ
ncbi:MAG: alpha-L-rhamnosidase C-terminal domain-containing protein [Faecousia sp.]